MGWRINLVKNTVKIDSEIALRLYQSEAQIAATWQEEAGGYPCPILLPNIYNGLLVFNQNHLEHMDYVWEPEILDILCHYEVEGDICFCSFDGDNRGEYWGYRFDGRGGQVGLTKKGGKWGETGKSLPRGKGILTCKKCGGHETKLMPRGSNKRNAQVCVGCKSDKLEFIYPFPGGDYLPSNKHIGSSVKSLYKETGELAEVQKLAKKKIKTTKSNLESVKKRTAKKITDPRIEPTIITINEIKV